MRKLFPHLLALVSLIGLNLYQFRDHYFSGDIFNFDFLASYYPITASWLKMFSVGSVPLWNPYSSLGFPTHLSLQNGSFYLPLLVADILGANYNLYFAVVFQCAHVLLGGVGVYLLIFSLQKNYYLALLGAVIFTFSVASFGNAQHPDIIRGYTYIPFIFYFLIPANLNRRFALACFALILFSFGAGSYPGILISGFYAFGLFFVLQFWLAARNLRKAYLLQALSAGLCAALLLALKFLPLFLFTNELSLIQADPLMGRTQAQNLWTLFTTYNNSFFSADVTMRSLFMPAVVFFIIAFCCRRIFTKASLPWLLVLGLSIVLGYNFWFSVDLYNLLPGLNSNRFALIAWRPFFQISLILIMVLGLGALSRREFASPFRTRLVNLVVLSAGGGIAIALLVAAAKSRIELSSTDLELIWQQLVLSLIAAVMTLTILSFKFKNYFLLLPISLVIYSAGSYAKYYPHYHTWSIIDFCQQSPIEPLLDCRAEIPAIAPFKAKSRPARVLNTFYTDDGNLSPLRNEFAVIGYDGGIKLRKNNKIIGDRAVNGQAAKPDTLKFLSDRSRHLIFPLSLASASTVRDCLHTPECLRKNYGNTAVTISSFSENGASFKASLKDSALMVENEIYYRGWQAKLTFSDHRIETIQAHESVDGLRAWKLPAGDFLLETRFVPPLWGLAKICAGAGFVLLCLLCFIRPAGIKQASVFDKDPAE